MLLIESLVKEFMQPELIPEGFPNKGMITVAILFVLSESIRQSGA